MAAYDSKVKVLGYVAGGIQAGIYTMGYRVFPWTFCVARLDAVCKLSGQPIKSGDHCYRPQTNASCRQWRILASEVKAIIGEPPDEAA